MDFWATINFVGKMMVLNDEHNAALAQKASGTITILYTSVNTLLRTCCLHISLLCLSSVVPLARGVGNSNACNMRLL